MTQTVDIATTLLGESKAVRALRAQVQAAAAASLPVLLYGPAGSGKERTAWAIHAASQRRGPFMPFNMSRVSELILRDTPWDTLSVTPGDFRDFSGGTVFLHEIAQLRPSSQTLLFQALKGHLLHQRRAAASPHTGLRIIAATSISPKALIHTGHFHERLLRRLGGIRITIPSLAERRKDIPTLALYFLSLLPASQRPLGCTASAIRRLKTFDWPENVRDLKRVITAAAKLAPREMLDEMTIEFARKTTDCGTQRPQAPTATTLPADAPQPPPSSHDADDGLSLVKQTVSRWLRPPKLSSSYPRLTPSRTRTP